MNAHLKTYKSVTTNMYEYQKRTGTPIPEILNIIPISRTKIPFPVRMYVDHDEYSFQNTERGRKL